MLWLILGTVAAVCLIVMIFIAMKADPTPVDYPAECDGDE